MQYLEEAAINQPTVPYLYTSGSVGAHGEKEKENLPCINHVNILHQRQAMISSIHLQTILLDLQQPTLEVKLQSIFSGLRHMFFQALQTHLLQGNSGFESEPCLSLD
jgi:hypothetical protein